MELVGLVLILAFVFLLFNVGMLDLTVRSNSSKSGGLKSRPGSCPYAPVA